MFFQNKQSPHIPLSVLKIPHISRRLKNETGVFTSDVRSFFSRGDSHRTGHIRRNDSHYQLSRGFFSARFSRISLAPSHLAPHALAKEPRKIHEHARHFASAFLHRSRARRGLLDVSLPSRCFRTRGAKDSETHYTREREPVAGSTPKYRANKSR